MIGRIAVAALDALYPPVCLACGGEVAGGGQLCAACFRDTAFIAGPVCERCGAPVPPDGESGDGESEAGGSAAGDGERLCDGCVHAPPAWRRGRAALVYEGAGRRLALALKHADRLDIAAPAARWMLRAGGGLVEAADLIAPAPLHWTRMIRRRYNQSAELARALARVAGRGGAAAPDLLVRIRRTESQDGRTREQRFENVAGAFRVSRRWRRRIAGARVLLVDDVLTTGATLSACAEACREAGAASVDVLALARVTRD